MVIRDKILLLWKPHLLCALHRLVLLQLLRRLFFTKSSKLIKSKLIKKIPKFLLKKWCFFYQNHSPDPPRSEVVFNNETELFARLILSKPSPKKNMSSEPQCFELWRFFFQHFQHCNFNNAQSRHKIKEKFLIDWRKYICRGH